MGDSVGGSGAPQYGVQGSASYSSSSGRQSVKTKGWHPNKDTMRTWELLFKDPNAWRLFRRDPELMAKYFGRDRDQFRGPQIASRQRLADIWSARRDKGLGDNSYLKASAGLEDQQQVADAQGRRDMAIDDQNFGDSRIGQRFATLAGYNQAWGLNQRTTNTRQRSSAYEVSGGYGS